MPVFALITAALFPAAGILPLLLLYGLGLAAALLAAAVLALVPVLIAYAVGNRYFVKGLSAGAVKG